MYYQTVVIDQLILSPLSWPDIYTGTYIADNIGLQGYVGLCVNNLSDWRGAWLYDQSIS